MHKYLNSFQSAVGAALLFLCAVSIQVQAEQTPVQKKVVDCPAWLNTDLQQLRSQQTINLCDLKQDKVLLLVNTASACGFTGQFEGLETLYQNYKDRGFTIAGFPSDSFFQEHNDAEKTAEVCYINYGVTFTMLESSNVRGKKANPVFTHLAKEKGAPKWNFYKYLITRDGQVSQWYNSKTEPNDKTLIADIEQALQTL